ncbi:hypothetical protein [Inhella crocodyli]|uniref:Uncharacterized protein n=1 Tax=Inhella crocodyli TaxID=2499851 RepID=A0A3S2UL29_9BURK|nr:hypothetical protein [Inhella crocodyli]RVT88704.1 hypothetical protein EOD73_06980 [Inhella crocodyli]
MIRRRPLLALGAGGAVAALGPFGALRGAAASPAPDAWWAWGPEGVRGPAGWVPWPAPPAGAPQAGAGALWWVDARPALQRLAADGALTTLPLAAMPDAWVPAPRGEGLLLTDGPLARLLDPTLREVHRWPLRDLAGRQSAPAAHALAHEGRRSLLLSLPGLGEVWELSLDPDAPPVFDGLVHDHRLGEAIARPGHHGVRRVPLREPGDAVPLRLHGVPDRPWVYGPVPGGVAVLNLDVRRRLATLPALDDLHAWQPQGGWLWLRQGERLQAFDAQRWQAGPTLPLPAPALQLVAAGAELWLRDASDRLWRGGPGKAWERQGSARALALAPDGRLGRLDDHWAAGLRGLQPAW